MLLVTLIAASWLAIATLVLTLCVMAKRGDRQLVAQLVVVHHGAVAPVDVRLTRGSAERLPAPVAPALN